MRQGFLFHKTNGSYWGVYLANCVTFFDFSSLYFCWQKKKSSQKHTTTT